MTTKNLITTNEVDKKYNKYNNRNSCSICYDDNNDDNWMKDIVSSMACPQNKRKTNQPVALVLALHVQQHWWCGLLWHCAPKKQSTCRHWRPPLMLCPLPAAPKKLINLWWWWFGLFPAALVTLPPLMAHPQKTTCGVCGLLWCCTPKKQLTCSVGGSVSVMGVVYWFCISSSIGSIAFFNAVSPQKQSVCMVTGLWHHVPPQKPVALVI